MPATILCFPRVLRQPTLAERRRGERAAERRRIEQEVEAPIERLDALDGDPDAEPDHDGEAEPDECSVVPLHLYVARAPVRRIGRAR
ncbi:hypothetical protein M0638_24975 [Roseomonas sp. NAR14]|uniref:Uncharacterized protein n=1 Tax=Roseomonas acroporae TaxID=2937791 RepID=A0A9X1YBC4_9PROT|nr:hypothetical protein [Roseomonas acroporae]MCK8787624.1 hypothetical protein [Roseomonas acroporae]